MAGACNSKMDVVFLTQAQQINKEAEPREEQESEKASEKEGRKREEPRDDARGKERRAKSEEQEERHLKKHFLPSCCVEEGRYITASAVGVQTDSLCATLTHAAVLSGAGQQAPPRWPSVGLFTARSSYPIMGRTQLVPSRRTSVRTSVATPCCQLSCSRRLEIPPELLYVVTVSTMVPL